MLTSADKEGGGVWTSPFLADIICEQPLNTYIQYIVKENNHASSRSAQTRERKKSTMQNI